MAHIRSAGDRLGHGTESLANLKQVADQTAASATRLERELAQLTEDSRSALAKANNLTVEIAAIDSRMQPGIDAELPLLEDRERLQQQARNAAQLLAEAERDRVHHRAVLVAAEAELRRTRDELATVEARIAAISDEGALQAKAAAIDAAELEARQLSQQIIELRGLRDAAQYRVKELAAVDRTDEERVSGLRNRVNDLRAELSGTRERVGAVERQIRERLNAELSADVVDAAATLSGEIENISTRETGLRTALTSLEMYMVSERRRVLDRQLQELRVAESAITRDLATMARAQTRFGEISRAIQDRSEAEAQSAAERLKAAIQECLVALYPHRHLDRIELSLPEANILLTDRYLSQAVEPYLYVSTGQLNVLALAVFVAASLRQRLSELGFMMLDEPVQNLDDVHFLAFITLTKRVALSRQVIFSTADTNIAELFRRQMKSSSAGDGQYIQYEWRSFDPRGGPDIVRVDTLGRPTSRRGRHEQS
jgi:uncharacterized protein YoxC